ncbi:MAG: YHYH protein [Rhodobacteraceae bacterium]|nr:YHYH protein [Paracoccaceae bacterium]
MFAAMQPVKAEANERCRAIAASIEDAGFGDDVSVECRRGHAIIHSDAYPDHELMTGIVGTNELVPVPALDHAAPIPLRPSIGDRPLTRDSSLGVAVNGVPIFDYTAAEEMSQADLTHHQTRHDTVLTKQLDNCGGHAGRGDDYHYHASPTCMIAQMENAGDAAIIGWAFDGFPIYGDNNPDGSPIRSSTLDVCNGQPDATFGYRYHTSEDAPYIIQCLMGKVANFDRLVRIPPLKVARGRGIRDIGRPPRNGVRNLVFTEYASGARSMDYTYRGQAYYVRYSPSGRANCYNFKTRTVTNKGAIETGVYCR